MQRIIGVKQLKFQESAAVFFKTRWRPPPTQHNAAVKAGEGVGVGGEVRKVKWYLHVTCG